MQLPVALIVATRSVRHEIESARPNAPAVAEQVRVQRFLRTRQALSRVLYATARLVAPDTRTAPAVPPSGARCATGAF